MHVLLCVVVVLCAVGVGGQTEVPLHQAECALQGLTTAHPELTGQVTLTTKKDTPLTNVAAILRGVPHNASFALHIHTYGELAMDAEDLDNLVGPIYDTDGEHPHGCPTPNSPRQWKVGNLGNAVWVGYEPGQWAGLAGLKADLPGIALSGPNTVLGRVLLVHEREDSCSGEDEDVGKPIAGCIIGLPEEDTQENNAEAKALDALGAGSCWLRPFGSFITSTLSYGVLNLEVSVSVVIELINCSGNPVMSVLVVV